MEPEPSTIGTGDPLAVAVVAAIHSGDVDALRRLLAEHPGLASARLGDDEADGMSRTLLHVATDWPGRFPRVASTLQALIDAGADVTARFGGPHDETPLRSGERATAAGPRSPSTCWTGGPS